MRIGISASSDVDTTVERCRQLGVNPRSDSDPPVNGGCICTSRCFVGRALTRPLGGSLTSHVFLREGSGKAQQRPCSHTAREQNLSIQDRPPQNHAGKESGIVNDSNR